MHNTKAEKAKHFDKMMIVDWRWKWRSRWRADPWDLKIIRSAVNAFFSIPSTLWLPTGTGEVLERLSAHQWRRLRCLTAHNGPVRPRKLVLVRRTGLEPRPPGWLANIIDCWAALRFVNSQRFCTVKSALCCGVKLCVHLSQAKGILTTSGFWLVVYFNVITANNSWNSHIRFHGNTLIVPKHENWDDWVLFGREAWICSAERWSFDGDAFKMGHPHDGVLFINATLSHYGFSVILQLS